MAVLACVKSFILTVLCGNPILKGTFVTVINSTIIALDLEITQLLASLGRLNIFNKITSFQINAITAKFDALKADLNLILGPLAQTGSCVTLSKFNEQLQAGLGGKKFRGFQKKLGDFQRSTNLAVAIDALIKQKEKLKNDLQDFVDEIAILCQ